jgi:hypothetical protein
MYVCLIQGELEGSQFYNQLIQSAKTSFLSLKRSSSSSVTDQIVEFLECNPIDNDFEYPDGPSDSDAWVTIEPSQLDNLFIPKNIDSESDSDNDEQLEEMDQVLSNLSNFLNKNSDIRGVTFEDSSDDEDLCKPITFDADTLLATMKNKVLEEPSKDEEQDSFEQMMAAMDMELAQKSANDYVANPDQVQVHVNLLKNTLESINAQAGNPGPINHILNTIR